MSGPLATPLFGIHEAALGVQSRRLELISANIANADTPGFQARDVDFAKALGQQQPLSTLRDGAHDYRRNAAQPSLDGNQVDLPMEQAAFADAVELPHAVGLVTDLSQHLVRRAQQAGRA